MAGVRDRRASLVVARHAGRVYASKPPLLRVSVTADGENDARPVVGRPVGTTSVETEGRLLAFQGFGVRTA